ncbi:hypothetical protein F4X90_12985 [Candidatus Poribacteria bacterium]|nr:hypothetical protein [Candidatus Poribacteria bacterium]
MTDERKQALRQLLQEAVANLEIRPYGGFEGLSITPDEYKWHLKRAWTSYSENSLWIVNHFTVDISGEIRSKFLEFIKVELDAFIHEDKILSASIFVFSHDMGRTGHKRNQTDGDSLNSFLQQLLKIAIFCGIERASSDFEKCTKKIGSSFQSVVLLTGITSAAEIPVFDGVHLIPLPNSTRDLPRCWGGLPNPNRDLYKKTLLVIDYSVFPIFHSPFLPAATGTNWEDKWDMQKARFRFEVKSREFSNFNETDFHEKFCQALSLACNSAVQIDTAWSYMAEDELFNINHDRLSTSFERPSSANSMTIKKSEIDESKRLYEKLINLNLNVARKLQIPIDRWIKSKTSKTAVDKIVDLGIALEAIYLSDISEKTELSFRLRLRAAWFLGKDKAHRQELMKDFSKIYEWRSKVVHTGKLPNRTRKTPFTWQEIAKFTEKGQDLCRDSIMKILEDGKFPDYEYWKNLILGEESS